MANGGAATWRIATRRLDESCGAVKRTHAGSWCAPHTLVAVGSQFVVGRYASTTVVEVQVGDLLVSPTGGEPITVHAGERW